MKRKSFTKITAVLLATVLLLQSVTAVISASAQTQSYTGTVLAAINTDYTESRLAKSFETETSANAQTASANAQSDQQRDDQKPWELLWDQVEPMTPEEAAAANALDAASVQAQRNTVPYRVGGTRMIPAYPDASALYNLTSVADLLKWIVDYIRSNKIQLTCVYTDDTCTVWIEDVNAWSETSIRDLAAYVDEEIPKLEDLFGDVRIDTDKDGKFAIFIHSMPQSQEEKEEKGGVALGYFMPIDLMDASGRIGNVRMKNKILNSLILGANADCFHINMDYSKVDLLKLTFVHEYQHYIHECYSYAGKDNKTYLKDDDIYINEGFSVASETLLASMDLRVNEMEYVFNHMQDQFSLVTWENHIANYGLVYPFFQYIRTRYAALTDDLDSDIPGKGIYKKVMQSRDRSNQDNTLGIIADILYPADRYPSLQDTDARCRQLITDFWLAVYYHAPQGEHGFNGEKWADNLCVYTSDFDTKPSIRNAMGVFYILDEGERDTVSIMNADEGMRFIAIEEPMRSVTLEPNGGVGEVYTAISTNAQYELPSREYSPFFKEGYSLAGWALTPDAETPVYAPEETIILNGSVTLYAVWHPVDRVQTDTAYSFDLPDGECVTAEFCPSEDGVYYIDCAVPFSALFVEYDGVSTTKLQSADAGIYLQANEKYTVYITFSAQEDAERVTGSYRLRQRSTYYTLRYYVDSEDEYYTQKFGVTYTVTDLNDVSEGMDFAGWSTKPDDTAAMYLPGDTITLTADTDLFAVWSPWYALQTDKTYTIEGASENLLFIPDKTAVYRLSTTPADRKYSFTLFSEEDNIDDTYSYYPQTRTHTLYEGHTYYIYTENIQSLCMELVSETLQHSLFLYVPNYLTGKPIRMLSMEMTGSNTYVLPDYRPVAFLNSDFHHWYNVITEEIYYPGDTIVLDRDTVLVPVPSTPAVLDANSFSSLILKLFPAFIRYVPVLLRCFVQRVRIFGLSKMNFKIPWLGL